MIIKLSSCTICSWTLPLRRLACSNIPFNGVVVDVDLDEDHAGEFELPRKHYNVTMAKFYGYQLQHRDIDGIALLQGD